MDASLQDIAVSMGLTGVMLSMLLMGLLIAYYGSTKREPQVLDSWP